MNHRVFRLPSSYFHPSGAMFVLLLPLILTAIPTLVRAQSSSSPLPSLVASERAFASATAELGIRNGFLLFFADSAITFQPEVGLYRDVLGKRPMPQYPLTTRLLWAPEEGDAAQSGDIGYTTGPAAVESVPASAAPLYSGWFFSIWKRQANGVWKVFIDVGIETPEHGIPIDSVQFVPAMTHGSGTTGGTLAEVQKSDAALNAALGSDLQSASGHFASSVRFHRNGTFPIKGIAAATAFLQEHPYGTASHQKAGISDSGDLAYAYGTYDNPSASGYYIRVWKLTDASVWKLVFDVTTEKL